MTLEEADATLAQIAAREVELRLLSSFEEDVDAPETQMPRLPEPIKQDIEVLNRR